MSKNIAELVSLYTRKCMLTGLKDFLTYHHIVKKEHKGPKNVENGAILNTYIHQWHHNHCELYDYKQYEENNDIMIEYKKLILLNPSWFEMWNKEKDIFYLENLIEYYKNKHDIVLVKKLSRSLDKRLNI